MQKIVSFGGGMQSMGLLVLAAQGKIDYKTVIFCNVGEDSEYPPTLKYVHEIAMPYAEKHGIELIELRKYLKDGSVDTLFQRLTRPGSRSIGIPVRMSTGAPSNRTCTVDFKIKIVDKWMKERIGKEAITERKKGLLKACEITDMSKENMPIALRRVDGFLKEHEPLAQVALGISLDEIQRVKVNMDPETLAWKVNDFPLIRLRMSRQDCINIIADAKLPIPTRSACSFCPYHSIQKWQDMRQNEPELFQQAVDLEKTINTRRASDGLDAVWFTNKLKPLEQATSELKQESMFEDKEDVCESGYCFL